MDVTIQDLLVSSFVTSNAGYLLKRNISFKLKLHNRTTRENMVKDSVLGSKKDSNREDCEVLISFK